MYLRLAALCDEAAKAILEVYNRPQAEQGIEAKADDSPLTEADLASHNVLVAGLPAIEDIPVISEESSDRTAHRRYWLIDPLDGTKEFVKRNGEFTVNVALIEDGVPVLGCVQVPVTGVCYFGDHTGAMRRNGAWEHIHAAPVDGPIKAVVSKSHRGEAVDAFLDNLRQDGHQLSDVSFGSSLKLCKVAEGSAHVYPRLGPTMPWDTAAAHAVCTAAGATVTDMGGVDLRYDDPGRLNPWFIVGGPGLDWAQYARGIVPA